MILYANVYSQSTGALFTTPPSSYVVNQAIGCTGGPTSYNPMPIGTFALSVGPFAVTKGVNYSFYAGVYITHAAGAGGTSGESSFQVTLSSVACGSCP